MTVVKHLTQKKKNILAKKHNCTPLDIDKMLTPNPNYKIEVGFEHFDHTAEELKKMPKLHVFGTPKYVLG